MFDPLTKRQKEILDFLRNYIQDNGVSPSLQEIKDTFKLSAISTVHEHLQNLRKKGYITKDINQARGITIRKKTTMNMTTVSIPIIGQVTGKKLFLSDKHTKLQFDKNLAEVNANSFVLKVTDDSLSSENISAGDTLILNSKDLLKNNTLVLFYSGKEKTLKCGIYEKKQEKDSVRSKNQTRAANVKPGDIIGVLASNIKIF